MTEKEIEVTIIQADEHTFLALCNQYAGLTGEGPTQEAAVEDLTAKLQEYLENQATQG